MEDSGIDSDPKPHLQIEDDYVAGSDTSSSSHSNAPPKRKTTKQLQRKLEARIEQAKRIQRNAEYKKLIDSEATSSSNNPLISIKRLPIPSKKRRRQNTLIELCHSGSDSEDETTLFPVSRERPVKRKQDLTDTFSIEELSEASSEDSLHLGNAHENHPSARTLKPSGCFSCNRCLIM